MAAWDQLEARLKRRVPGSDHQDPSTPSNMRAKHGWKGNHPITFGGGVHLRNRHIGTTYPPSPLATR